MREILFKAKRLDNGEWVEGFLFHCLNNGEEWCIGKEPLSANDYSEIIGEYRTWFPIDEKTICQYTGLTDKNRNKIWENDIVEVWWVQRTLEKPIEPKKYKAVVEFGNPNGLYSWGWQLRFLEDFPFNNDILLWIDMEEAGAYCEVIGNIGGMICEEQ